MNLRMFIATAALLAFFTAGPAAAAADDADDVVGTILEVEGQATLTPEGGQAETATVNTPLHMDDVVKTEQKSKIFILFIDNTQLTLSENAEVKVDDYVYDPDDNTDDKARYSVLSGAFQYVSGLIGKKPNPDVQVATPVGSIGIRGTNFWAGKIDGDYGVAVADGQVALKTDAGEALVNKGEGTSVRDRRSRPERAQAWDHARFQRVAGTVALKRRDVVRQRIGDMQTGGRQRALQSHYKNYMKANRKGGQWQQRPRNPRRHQEMRQDKRENLQQRQKMRQNQLQIQPREKAGHLSPRERANEWANRAKNEGASAREKAGAFTRSASQKAQNSQWKEKLGGGMQGGQKSEPKQKAEDRKRKLEDWKDRKKEEWQEKHGGQ